MKSKAKPKRKPRWIVVERWQNKTVIKGTIPCHCLQHVVASRLGYPTEGETKIMVLE